MSFGFEGNPLAPLTRFGKAPTGFKPVPIFLSTTSGILVGDKIQIMLNSGELFTTTVTTIVPQSEIQNIFGPSASGAAIFISPVLPANASAGNIVIDLTQSK